MERPLVSIVIATYFPNQTYFIKQLRSIEEQSYRNIEVIICDDSACEEVYFWIEKTSQKIIKKYPIKMIKNFKNVGSNKTFERLTNESNGEYICYCDQDDIWVESKIEKLVNLAVRKNSVLVYSDLSLIDREDKLICKSFKKSNFRLKHVYGNDEKIFSFLIHRNSVTGCAMLINAKTAKGAIPFPLFNEYVHDHWLAVYASNQGGISYIEEPLVMYRMHGNNQVGNGRLKNIDNVEDYINSRLIFEIKKTNELLTRLKTDNKRKKIIYSKLKKLELRLKLSKKVSIKNIINLFPYAKEDITLFVFEIFLFSLPKYLSVKLLNLLKK